MVTETDRNKARSAVVSAYHALDCVTIPFSFLHAFADAAVDAVSKGAEPVPMDDEDRTPMPAGFDDALWRKADEVHHDMALVARDQECVKIIYAALSTHNAEPVKTAPAVAVKALRDTLEWYGEQARLAKLIHSEGDPGRWALAEDGGKRANSALSAQVQDVAGELSRINEMMDGGDDEGSPILPEFKDGWSVEAKVEACLHLLEKRRDVIEGFTAKENWRDDPAQDERWNAGLDFAMLQLCKVLKVDPQSINWDCATETLEGDAQSQIHKVLAAASPASKHGDAE